MQPPIKMDRIVERIVTRYARAMAREAARTNPKKLLEWLRQAREFLVSKRSSSEVSYWVNLLKELGWKTVLLLTEGGGYNNHRYVLTSPEGKSITTLLYPEGGGSKDVMDWLLNETKLLQQIDAKIEQYEPLVAEREEKKKAPKTPASFGIPMEDVTFALGTGEKWGTGEKYLIDFGVLDASGRPMGYQIVIGPPREPDGKWTVTPHQMRRGKTFGALQREVELDSRAECVIYAKKIVAKAYQYVLKVHRQAP